MGHISQQILLESDFTTSDGDNLVYIIIRYYTHTYTYYNILPVQYYIHFVGARARVCEIQMSNGSRGKRRVRIGWLRFPGGTVVNVANDISHGW